MINAVIDKAVALSRWIERLGIRKAEARTNRQNKYFCMKCGSYYAQRGDCKTCSEEPLLNLDNAETHLQIEDIYHRERNTRFGQLLALSVVLFGVPTFFVFMGIFVWLEAYFRLGTATDLIVGLISVMAVFLATSVLMAFFPPRCHLPQELPDENEPATQKNT